MKDGAWKSTLRDALSGFSSFINVPFPTCPSWPLDMLRPDPIHRSSESL